MRTVGGALHGRSIDANVIGPRCGPYEYDETHEGVWQAFVLFDGTAGKSSTPLRVGFVELIDAAPLIAALELGYFADEGLRVDLERQIGWGNVRDKLVFGHLAASHALVGMPPVSHLGQDRFPAPLASIMSLGTGGNAITFGRRLTDVGVDDLQSLARHVRSRNRVQTPLLAHVFGCSMHHYLLRDWLASGGIDPDREVTLCVLPPSQVNRQLTRSGLDGFCAGEPWNTAADQDGLGTIVAVTTDLLPDHPEKVLATSQRWLAKNESLAEALIRAVLRGCEYCSHAENFPALAKMLSKPQYLDMPENVLLKSLTIDRWYGRPGRRGPSIRSCSPATTFPSATHGAWLLAQMQRWGHVPADVDTVAIAKAAVNSGPYRRVAAQLNLQCPPDDLPPMRLTSGWFDPKQFSIPRNSTPVPTPGPGFRAPALPARQGVQ